MLALLPQVLFLGTFAATVIRITLACMMAYDAWTNASKPDTASRFFAFLQIVIAATIFTGAWTQAAAIIAVIMCAVSLALPRFRVWPRSTVALMLIMALTLIVTGPGAIAFDLPL